MNKPQWLGAAIAPAFAAVAFADGNVQVSVEPTTRELRIIGDAAANDVEVTYDGVAGAYTVTGKNGTTVNLGAAASVIDVGAIFASMDDGDDTLKFTNTPTRSDLRIRLGEGADTLILASVRVRGRTAIRGEGGADHVIASDGSVFLGTVNYLGSDLADNVEFLNSVFHERVLLRMSLGDDNVLLQSSTFEGRAQLILKMGGGDDRFEVNDCTLDSDLRARLGSGDDHAILDSTDFNLDCEIDAGAGNDDNLSLRSGNNFQHRSSFRNFES